MSTADPLADEQSSALPVLDAARTYERDRYLAALLAPADVRDDLVALAAYIGELKRVPLQTRDAAIGEIRLQWWRDALAEAGGTTGHPVADALKDVVRRRGLPLDTVRAPIEGFSREHYEDGIRDADELKLYTQETDGTAIWLALAVLGKPGDVEESLALQAGSALALARLAGALPLHLAHGRLPLPEDLIKEAGDPRGLEGDEARAAVRGMTERLCAQSKEALEAFRRDQDRLGSGQLSAFLPVSLVSSYLTAALKPGRDVLLQPADISPLSRVTRLWFASVRGRL